MTLSFISKEAYSTLIEGPLNDISDHLRSLRLYSDPDKRWFVPFDNENFTVSFEYRHYRIESGCRRGDGLKHYSLFKPVGCDENDKTTSLAWDHITPGCIVRVMVTFLSPQSLTDSLRFMLTITARTTSTADGVSNRPYAPSFMVLSETQVQPPSMAAITLSPAINSPFPSGIENHSSICTVSVLYSLML